MADALSTESLATAATMDVVSSASTTMDDESSDSGEQNRPKRNERIEKLGFKPQKELFCNKFLPYADQLDDESQAMLVTVKNNLGKAVAMRDIGLGAAKAVRQLITYLRLYGMKFSKEDHIKFVKLLLEMLVIPKLDPKMLARISDAIYVLLKKREYISPEELQVEWRPLYDLFQLVITRKNKRGELFNTLAKSGKAKESKIPPQLSQLLAVATEMGFDVSALVQFAGGVPKAPDEDA